MWRSLPLVLLAACATPVPLSPEQVALKDDVANLENASTPGYRAVDSRDGIRRRSQTQGRVVRTGRPFDMAVCGEGLFRVQRGDASAYTRAGRFRADVHGQVTLENGWMLAPMFVVPKGVSRIVVDRFGLVQGFDPNKPRSLRVLGQLTLTRFERPEALETEDGVLFRWVPGAGAATTGRPGHDAALGELRQGSIELSNMSPLHADLALRRRLRAPADVAGGGGSE